MILVIKGYYHLKSGRHKLKSKTKYINFQYEILALQYENIEKHEKENNNILTTVDNVIRFQKTVRLITKKNSLDKKRDQLKF